MIVILRDSFRRFWIVENVMHSIDRLPTLLGGGILGVAFFSLGFGVAGVSLGLTGELISAAIGAAAVSKFS
jgi:hypothetical protein